MKLDARVRFPADKAQQDRKLTDLFNALADQLNRLSEGQIVASYTARTSVPTTGTWQQGDFVRNSTPAEAGGAGAKYVVFGWIRLTSGSNNVLNTDWVAARVLTGN